MSGKEDVIIKLKKDADLKQFLQTVQTCGQDVYYETLEGDCLNLSSILSGYIFTASALEKEFLEKGEIICGDEMDYEKIAAYVETGELSFHSQDS